MTKLWLCSIICIMYSNYPCYYWDFKRDIVPFFFRLKKDKVMLNDYVTCVLYMYIQCNIKCIVYYRYNAKQYDNILKYILQWSMYREQRIFGKYNKSCLIHEIDTNVEYFEFPVHYIILWFWQIFLSNIRPCNQYFMTTYFFSFYNYMHFISIIWVKYKQKRTMYIPLLYMGYNNWMRFTLKSILLKCTKSMENENWKISYKIVATAYSHFRLVF